MMYYEIYNQSGLWVIWQVSNGGQYYHERVKSFKTKKGAENWAAKQWNKVIWR